MPACLEIILVCSLCQIPEQGALQYHFTASPLISRKHSTARILGLTQTTHYCLFTTNSSQIMVITNFWNDGVATLTFFLQCKQLAGTISKELTACITLQVKRKFSRPQHHFIELQKWKLQCIVKYLCKNKLPPTFKKTNTFLKVWRYHMKSYCDWLTFGLVQS